MPHELAECPAILRERRLVEYDSLRRRRERGPDRKAPLLPARERERVRRREPAQPQTLEELTDAPLDVGGPKAERAWADTKLVVDAASDELMLGILEHRADPANEHAGRPSPGRLAERAHRAALRFEQTGEKHRER